MQLPVLTKSPAVEPENVHCKDSCCSVQLLATRCLSGSRVYLWCVEVLKFGPKLLGVSYSTSLLIITKLDVLFCHKQGLNLMIYTRPQNSVPSPPQKKFKLYHFQVSKACACLDLSPQPCCVVLACKTHLAHVSTASQVHNTRAQPR